MIHFFSNKLSPSKLERYFNELENICQKRILDNLYSQWGQQTELRIERLNNQLKNRPIIYSGGGSTIKTLQRGYLGFIERHLLSYDIWKSKEFDDKSIFEDSSLCPILSTAYVLSISVSNDVIEKKPFKDIFKEVRGKQEEKEESSFGSALGGFDYGLDDSAWK